MISLFIIPLIFWGNLLVVLCKQEENTFLGFLKSPVQNSNGCSENVLKNDVVQIKEGSDVNNNTHSVSHKKFRIPVFDGYVNEGYLNNYSIVDFIRKNVDFKSTIRSRTLAENTENMSGEVEVNISNENQKSSLSLDDSTVLYTSINKNLNENNSVYDKVPTPTTITITRPRTNINVREFQEEHINRESMKLPSVFLKSACSLKSLRKKMGDECDEQKKETLDRISSDVFDEPSSKKTIPIFNKWVILDSVLNTCQRESTNVNRKEKILEKIKQGLSISSSGEELIHTTLRSYRTSKCSLKQYFYALDRMGKWFSNFKENYNEALDLLDSPEFAKLYFGLWFLMDVKEIEDEQIKISEKLKKKSIILQNYPSSLKNIVYTEEEFSKLSSDLVCCLSSSSVLSLFSLLKLFDTMHISKKYKEGRNNNDNEISMKENVYVNEVEILLKEFTVFTTIFDKIKSKLFTLQQKLYDLYELKKIIKEPKNELDQYNDIFKFLNHSLNRLNIMKSRIKDLLKSSLSSDKSVVEFFYRYYIPLFVQRIFLGKLDGVQVFTILEHFPKILEKLDTFLKYSDSQKASIKVKNMKASLLSEEMETSFQLPKEYLLLLVTVYLRVQMIHFLLFFVSYYLEQIKEKHKVHIITGKGQLQKNHLIELGNFFNEAKQFIHFGNQFLQALRKNRIIMNLILNMNIISNKINAKVEEFRLHNFNLSKENSESTDETMVEDNIFYTQIMQLYSKLFTMQYYLVS